MAAGTGEEEAAVGHERQHEPEDRRAGRGAGQAELVLGAVAEGGSFRVEGLEPGRYTVMARAAVLPLGPDLHGWSVVDVPAAGTVQVVRRSTVP